MNFFTKSRLLVGSIVLLAALNIATWVTIAIRKPNTESKSEQFDSSGGPGRFMARELGLSPEQEQRMGELRQEFHQKIGPIRQEIGSSYHSMMLEVGADKPSQERLDSFAEAIGHLHRQHQIVTINHFLQVREVCTPEQLTKLKELYPRMAPRGDRLHRMHRHNRSNEMDERPIRRRDGDERPRRRIDGNTED